MVKKNYHVTIIFVLVCQIVIGFHYWQPLIMKRILLIPPDLFILIIYAFSTTRSSA